MKRVDVWRTVDTTVLGRFVIVVVVVIVFDSIQFNSAVSEERRRIKTTITTTTQSRGPLSHEQCSPACTSYDGARKDDVMKLQLMTPTHLR